MLTNFFETATYLLTKIKLFYEINSHGLKRSKIEGKKKEL